MDHKLYLVFLHFGFAFISCSHALLREYHYINVQMTWADAQHYCRTKYTDLATIESIADLSRLKRPVEDSSWAWIGLTDDPQSWKGVMGNDANSWRWSATGETSTTEYQNWDVSEPDNANANEKCTGMKPDGKWFDGNCYMEKHFACFNGNSSGQRTYILIANAQTWEGAQAYCRTHHTDLAMIENDEQNAEIRMMLTEAVWIGLYREPWRWSDKSNSSFKNWNSGQPNNYNGQYCGTENSDHFWGDESCNSKKTFWCQKVDKYTRTLVKMKFQTDADLSHPATNNQILQQLSASLRNGGLAGAKLMWKTQPKEEKD